MNEYIFLFDLDSTITKKEILPTIAEKIGIEKEMRDLTEATMRGELEFRESFLNRVKLLSDIDISIVSEMVKNIEIDEDIANFITKNSDRCFVVTGNIDKWIHKLMIKLKMQDNYYCSRIKVKNDRIEKIITIMDKEILSRTLVPKFVAIGDGSNDVGMCKNADISIGYGGVRDISPVLLNHIDFAFYDGKRCVEFLEKLL